MAMMVDNYISWGILLTNILGNIMIQNRVPELNRWTLGVDHEECAVMRTHLV